MKAKASLLKVIDCSKITGPLDQIENTEAFQDFAKELGDGMSQIGFVYFINHGVSPSLVEIVLEKSRKFFELPKEIKFKYRKNDAVQNFHGYQVPEEENLGELVASDTKFDYKEAFDFNGPDCYLDAGYPSEVPGWKNIIDEYKKPFLELSRKIFRSFAIYLNLADKDFFINRHTSLEHSEVKSQTQLRSCYYMAQDSNFSLTPEMMRVSEHQDWGTITFLIQDLTGGLEAKPLNGDWIPVPPIQGSIVLNAGLMLEMWSGGRFPATNHRVRLGQETAPKLRQSIAYFVQPDGDSICTPIVPLNPEWDPTYPKVENETAYEYFQNRVRRSRVY